MQGLNRFFPELAMIAFVFFILAPTGGCSSRGDRFHDPMMDFGSVQTVAIMPFSNLTRETAAAERVRDTFTTMLLATGGLYVVPPGETARGISRTGMVNPAQPSPEEVKKFAGITGVDAVITGVVREYGEVRSGSTSSPVISLSLQMLDRESGMVVWTGSATKGGITFADRLFGGGGKPMDEITRKAVAVLIDRLFEES